MKRAAIACSLLASLSGAAQVQLSAPLVLTGAEQERRVEGIAAPLQGDALVTLAGEARGAWQWASAQQLGNAITLVLAPPLTAYRDGLLVRFPAPSTAHGPITLDVDGLGARPLLRPDGLVPVAGQLQQGVVCEALLADGRFILLSAPERGCPPQSLDVNGRYCIDVASPGGFLFYDALSYCANRGGKLCTWDEHYAACAILGAQLTSLFNQWEWIDDTSNHSHTADQAGRTTCQSQRSTGPPDVILGEARCCYHPR